MQSTPGHDEACSTPCYLVCRIKTKLGDKTSRTYICIKENNIGHMMNNASHLRLPLFLWNFVVSPSGPGVTLWSAMIETNRLVLLNREAPVVPKDSARTDRIRNALTACKCNSSMGKQFHPFRSVWRKYLSIANLQWLHRWSFRMHILLHPNLHLVMDATLITYPC